jgi:hypothetical protein
MTPSAPHLHRPFIGVLFRCCNVYARAYRSPGGVVYEGRCPRCGRSVRATVGPGGVDQRFFQAG